MITPLQGHHAMQQVTLSAVPSPYGERPSCALRRVSATLHSRRMGTFRAQWSSSEQRRQGCRTGCAGSAGGSATLTRWWRSKSRKVLLLFREEHVVSAVLAMPLHLVAAYQLFALHDTVACRTEELLFNATAALLVNQVEVG